MGEARLIRPEGPVPYGVANEWMHGLAEQRLSGEIPDTLILLEHPPVYTAGKRTASAALATSPPMAVSSFSAHGLRTSSPATRLKSSVAFRAVSIRRRAPSRGETRRSDARFAPERACPS